MVGSPGLLVTPLLQPSVVQASDQCGWAVPHLYWTIVDILSFFPLHFTLWPCSVKVGTCSHWVWLPMRHAGRDGPGKVSDSKTKRSKKQTIHKVVPSPVPRKWHLVPRLQTVFCNSRRELEEGCGDAVGTALPCFKCCQGSAGRPPAGRVGCSTRQHLSGGQEPPLHGGLHPVSLLGCIQMGHGVLPAGRTQILGWCRCFWISWRWNRFLRDYMPLVFVESLEAMKIWIRFLVAKHTSLHGVSLRRPKPCLNSWMLQRGPMQMESVRERRSRRMSVSNLKRTSWTRLLRGMLGLLFWESGWKVSELWWYNLISFISITIISDNFGIFGFWSKSHCFGGQTLEFKKFVALVRKSGANSSGSSQRHFSSLIWKCSNWGDKGGNTIPWWCPFDLQAVDGGRGALQSSSSCYCRAGAALEAELWATQGGGTAKANLWPSCEEHQGKGWAMLGPRMHQQGCSGILVQLGGWHVDY